MSDIEVECVEEVVVSNSGELIEAWRLRSLDEAEGDGTGSGVCGDGHEEGGARWVAHGRRWTHGQRSCGVTRQSLPLGRSSLLPSLPPPPSALRPHGSLETRIALEVDHTVDLEFFLPGISEPMRAQGVVVRKVPESSAFGIRFGDLAEKSRALIVEFVQRRARGQAPLPTAKPVGPK